MLAGGGALDRPGYFIAPTVVTGVAEGTRLVDEEQFGPVLPLLAFTEVEAAVTRANANSLRSGRLGMEWAIRNVRLEIARRLEAGTVWINSTGGPSREFLLAASKSRRRPWHGADGTQIVCGTARSASSAVVARGRILLG